MSWREFCRHTDSRVSVPNVNVCIWQGVWYPEGPPKAARLLDGKWAKIKEPNQDVAHSEEPGGTYSGPSGSQDIL